jgi:hypothetical protein
MFRLPKIDAPTDSGKIKQIEDFLFQFVREVDLEFESVKESTEKKKE